MDMMTRRRAMMAGIALPEWDVEWAGTDGEYPTAKGFDVTGTASVTLLTQSVRITATSSKFARYNYPSDASIGVFEGEFAIFSTNGYFVISFGDGSKEISVRMQHSANYKGIYLRDASTLANCTKLQTIADSTRYKIKLVARVNDADVYIDDVLVASNIDYADIPYTNDYKGAIYQGTGSSNSTGNIYFMRMKFGRTS